MNKFILNFKIFESLLLEGFDVKEFKDFTSKLSNLEQTKYIVMMDSDINSDVHDKLLNITDITDDNLLKIKGDKHNITTKPGRYIKSAVEHPMSKRHAEIKSEEFTNSIKSFKIKDSINFVELKGDGCHKNFSIYSDDPVRGSHFLGNDCMRHSRCSNYFGIIEKNPKVISILYGFIDGKYIGFSIIYNCNGQKYYDRIYGYNVEHAVLIELECLKRGYKNLYNKDLDLDIKLDEWIFDYYPYKDSFKYLNINKGILSTKNKSDLYDDDKIVILNSTDGEYY
jgi:hypothetical protein